MQKTLKIKVLYGEKERKDILSSFLKVIEQNYNYIKVEVQNVGFSFQHCKYMIIVDNYILKEVEPKSVHLLLFQYSGLIIRKLSLSNANRNENTKKMSPFSSLFSENE